ncbi:unnamed protein product [Notodromas monacha]|uniref:acid phosphatase n=1 Tax=Notodromas monacha TaxID=399045 RepID=A0A7R9BZ86_9CRUS|nr:unnamed protein product [Notodromas monacha]CAG0922842.1 unnamed protein product [Notodromas monacha]
MGNGMRYHIKFLFIAFVISTISGQDVRNDGCNPDMVFTDTGSPACDANDGTLELLQVVFRHGDRTPIQFYPTDPWRHGYNWPRGLGQLTPDGKRRLVCLGNWVQTSYERFLCGGYNSTLYPVRSTNTDRTMQSAELFMMGTFPPLGGISEDMMDRVPLNLYDIKRVPCDKDTLLRRDTFCPAARTEEFRVRKNNRRLKMLAAENADAHKCILANSGLPPSMDLFQMSTLLYDLLTVERQHNMCLPEWTRSIYPKPVQHLAGIDMFMTTYSPLLTRLRVGKPDQQFLETNVQEIVIAQFELNLFKKRCAGHDSTVSGLLGAFGYSRSHFPEPAAGVFIELRKKWDGTKTPYYVKVYYKRGSLVETLKIPGCKCMCKLTDANALLKPIQLTEKMLKSECEECGDDAECLKAKESQK